MGATSAGPEATAGVRVRASGLRSRRGDTEVLAGISLAIEPGELMAIVGGSGAGKTTLLDALAGVTPADEGTVELGGLSSSDPRARSLLGYVPQDDIVHMELPLERMLRYAAGLRLPRGSDIDARVEEVLHDLDLSARRSVAVRALSGGQRKRASIAVELLSRPRVFFLDEPTSGLDPVTAAELVGLLRKLADAGTAVVFTTHALPG